jgi:hypothetical protein
MGSSRLFRMARGVQARAIDTIGRNRGSDERCRTAGVCNSAIRRMSASGQTRSPSSVAIGGRCSSESGYHQCRPRFLRWAMPPAPILDPSLRPFPWSHRRDRLSDRREGSRMRRREFIAGVGGAVARSSTMGLCVWVGAWAFLLSSGVVHAADDLAIEHQGIARHYLMHRPSRGENTAMPAVIISSWITSGRLEKPYPGGNRHCGRPRGLCCSLPGSNRTSMELQRRSGRSSAGAWKSRG